MSESIIADFLGKFNAEQTLRGEPVAGRILLSRKRLVLAADGDTNLQIPLSSIFDVAVGSVPADLGDFFDSTVTVAFDRGGERYLAAIEADDEKIQKFSTVLFRAILDGTPTSLAHPARRGGVVVDQEFGEATLQVRPGVARFETDDGVVAVDLSAVIGFDRDSRTVGDRPRPVVAVHHETDTGPVTTYATTGSSRKRSILGRFLRLEYADDVADLADVDLSTAQRRLLLALYADANDLATVLDVDAGEIAGMFADLATADLLTRGDDGPELTHLGRVAVSSACRDESV